LNARGEGSTPKGATVRILEIDRGRTGLREVEPGTALSLDIQAKGTGARLGIGTIDHRERQDTPGEHGTEDHRQAHQ